MALIEFLCARPPARVRPTLNPIPYPNPNPNPNPNQGFAAADVQHMIPLPLMATDAEARARVRVNRNRGCAEDEAVLAARSSAIFGCRLRSYPH